eukprot:TRINITY_DN8909_c0_g2_i2.p1 TRINITY_DN8909_c0_g2~~TRINITY_DN8909_c0_g2_i2.p1  ORF type:complete len:347 (-),score=53.02 TRINITY_DN8909_c0_g2_i2:183-1223(-)
MVSVEWEKTPLSYHSLPSALQSGGTDHYGPATQANALSSQELLGREQWQALDMNQLESSGSATRSLETVSRAIGSSDSRQTTIDAAELADVALHGTTQELKEVVTKSPGLVHSRHKLHYNAPLLLLCALHGKSEMIKVLLDAAANVNQSDDEDATPVLASAQGGHLEAMQVLLASRADVNKASQDGTTPIFFAAQEGHDEMLKLLIDARADPNSQREDGVTPISMASQKHRLSTVSMLIQAGANVNLCNSQGGTPVHVVANTGCLDVLELLLLAFADPNATKNNGVTPVYTAASEGHEHIVVALATAKADVRRTVKRRSPLDVATANKHSVTAEALRALMANHTSF